MRREILVLAAVAAGLALLVLHPARLIRNVLAPAALAVALAFLAWGIASLVLHWRSSPARRAGLLRLALGVFIGSNALFPRYLPDTPGLGYMHLGLVTASGAVLLWLFLRRPKADQVAAAGD